MTDRSDFVPSPVAVRRIAAHLLGEDMMNVKVAIESFPNGYTVTRKSTSSAFIEELIDILGDAESDGIIGPYYTPRKLAEYIAESLASDE